jgi:hypothetical protein
MVLSQLPETILEGMRRVFTVKQPLTGLSGQSSPYCSTLGKSFFDQRFQMVHRTVDAYRYFSQETDDEAATRSLDEFYAWDIGLTDVERPEIS